jgi:16S rRNA (guanine527-N7)-methyltransferase
MEYTEFWTILSANNIILTVEQIEQFKRYEKELRYWNEKINLISRQDISHILDRHFLHSLAILKYVEFPQKARCLDFGTGGGFPGLPIKIASPDIFLTLCDSIKKKINTTEMFANHTELRNIECFCGRIEELNNNKKYQKYFDIICTRAVGPTEKLIEWTLPLIKKNGKYVLLKGGNLDEEILSAKSKFPQFDIQIIDIQMIGMEWFQKESKKIVIITHK